MFCSKKCYDDFQRGKPIINRRGKNHWNWQNGKTSLYRRLRKMLEMDNWRVAIFKRDNYTCQMCGAHGGRKNPLNAHHLWKFTDILNKNKINTTEQARECRDLWLLDNGITVCEKCHNKTHSKGGKNDY